MAGGTLVTIAGTNLDGASSVLFGTVAGSFTVVDDSTITAWAPPQAAATVDVTVTTPSGVSSTSSADHVTYTTVSSPTINAITPATGSTAGGDVITVLGSGFLGTTSVSFGGVAAEDFTVLSDSALTAVAPMEASGTVDVSITTLTATTAVVTADEYTYTDLTASAPAVTGVSPATGATAGGQVVTITGTDFTGTSAVSFGGTAAASFTILSDTQISAVAPSAGSSGAVDVTVTTNNGTSTAVTADEFTYLATAAPTVTGLGTTSGTTAGGTSVGVTGTDFTSASQVLFGSTPATSFTVNSSTSITATAPAGYAGAVDLTVTTPSGVSATSSSDEFTYTAASAPAISSLGTTSGSTAGGASVTINGTDLGGALSVTFGGVEAASFTIVSGTEIDAVTPASFAGTIDVVVTTTAGDLDARRQLAIHVQRGVGPGGHVAGHDQRHDGRRHDGGHHRNELHGNGQCDLRRR